MANGYLGSPTILTSTANQEILPLTPNGWTKERYSFYKFSFINKDACQVKINGGDPIFLDAEQGFESTERDADIDSFVIVTNACRFSYIGAY